MTESSSCRGVKRLPKPEKQFLRAPGRGGMIRMLHDLREASISKDGWHFQISQLDARVFSMTEALQGKRADLSVMNSNRGFLSILMPQKLVPILVAPGVKMKRGPKSKCDGHERQT